MVNIIQARHVHSLAACPMAVGLVRCRRFPSMAPAYWTKGHGHTQVTWLQISSSLPVNFSLESSLMWNSIIWFNHSLALQCRLECESGYVAQRTPLITCVNGEYAKGCHYLQKWLNLIFLLLNIETGKRSQGITPFPLTISTSLASTFHLITVITR